MASAGGLILLEFGGILVGGYGGVGGVWVIEFRFSAVVAVGGVLVFIGYLDWLRCGSGW